MSSLVYGLKRSRAHDTRDGWYFITPGMAQAMLDNLAPNRPLREQTAQGYSGQIRDDLWRANGQAIVLNERDQVQDGQHRLRAIVLANKGAECYIVFGVPSAHFPSYDQGILRNAGDLSALLQYKHYAAVGAMARLTTLYLNGTLSRTGGGSGRMANGIIAQQLKRYGREFEASAIAIAPLKDGLRQIAPMAQMAFLHWLTVAARHKEITTFAEQVATGINLSRGDAVLVYRNRMRDLEGQFHKLLAGQRLAFLIKTWNAFVAKKSLGILRWREDEAFPVVEGATLEYGSANGAKRRKE